VFGLARGSSTLLLNGHRTFFPWEKKPGLEFLDAEFKNEWG
jgi:hypothetical protein